QLGHEFQGLVFAAEFLAGKGPGSEEVPACAAGGFRGRGDDLDAIFDQVVPVLDVLRVALAHQEHDGRGVRGAVVRQTGLPVRVDQLLVEVDRVDIAGQRQGHYVGTQT